MLVTPNRDVIAIVVISVLVTLLLIALVMTITYSYCKSCVLNSSEYRSYKRAQPFIAMIENAPDEKIDSAKQFITSYIADDSNAEEDDDMM